MGGGCDMGGEGKMIIMGLIVHPASKHIPLPCMSYILYLIIQYDLFIHYTLIDFTLPRVHIVWFKIW